MKFPPPYDQTYYNQADPNPWLALFLDQSIPMADEAKTLLMKNNASASRQYLLPLVRPLGRALIVLVQLIRLVCPKRLHSSRILHQCIYWGLKYCVSAEANRLILRHFTLGTEILQFIAANISGVKIETLPLRPQKLDDLRENIFLQHDVNIYNFIIQLNAQLREQGRQIEPPDQLDFSMISEKLPDYDVPQRWHNWLDVQSAIELYTPLYSLFLSDHDFWRASNSLQLDETIAIYVARLTNSTAHLHLVNNKHPMIPLATLEAGYRLMTHGLGTETMHGMLREMKKRSLFLADSEVYSAKSNE